MVRMPQIGQQPLFDELLNSGQQRRWVSVGLDEPDERVGLAWAVEGDFGLASGDPVEGGECLGIVL